MKSAYKDKLLAQIEGNGLPAPDDEYHFTRLRQWRFDFAWEDMMIVVDYQGGIFMKKKSSHTAPGKYINDCEKISEASVKGYIVIVTNANLVASGVTLDQIKRAFEKRRKDMKNGWRPVEI